ncbi:branched-chain amino acid transport system permease protein [Nitrobacteraceae bacterium AZCC 2161]
MFLDLFLNAMVVGILLGGFYAAVSIGVTISFGMLDIVNIAHPIFVVLGAFCIYTLNNWLGLDPIIAAILLLPVAYVLGLALYRIYHVLFERRGDEAIQGLAFFFGILFIAEVGLLMIFGVDYRFVQTPYSDGSTTIGFVLIQWRFLIALVGSLVMLGILYYGAKRTYFGRAVLAVAQDPAALRIVGVNPNRIKEIAFGISMATALVAGALLVIIQPIEPSQGREFIGRIFAIVVLGGMTSIPGTLVAAMAIGIIESMTMTWIGPSWAPAVAFGILLVMLAIKPAGVFGR